jgi:diguanylate cyclase (GGDEF)-like protein
MDTAERLRAVVAGHVFRFEGVELRLTVSVGVAATCGNAWATPAELTRTADARLYQAKQDGRNRVVGENEQGDAVGVASTVVAT